MHHRGESHQPNSRNSFTVADLFAGAGGFSVGFHLAGYESIFFNEMDERAGSSFAENLPDATPFICPIENLTAKRIREESRLGNSDLDVMIGGPPCQTFSVNAPSRNGDDGRNHLFRHFVRLVLEGIRPKFVVVENVPGLVSLDKGTTLHSIKAAFGQAGYRVIFGYLNAAHYGVPQERWRLFILGTRVPDIDLSFPPPVHYSYRRPNLTGGDRYILRNAIQNGAQDTLFDSSLRAPITVSEAIGDLPQISSGGGAPEMEHTYEAASDYQYEIRRGSWKVYNHECKSVSPINIERMQYVKPGGSWRDIPFRLLPKGMQRAQRSNHTKRYGRLHPEMLSPTIMTKCDLHWGTVYHYGQDRIISVREAARIQSFPDWFRFTGWKTDQYRQVGNAVPPKLARAIAEHIKCWLLASEYETNEDAPTRHLYTAG